MSVKLAARVVKYDAQGGSITLADGTCVSADLIVAADGMFLLLRGFFLSRFDADNNVAGVKSIARREVDDSDRPSFERTGFAAYRATVDVAKMKADPEISWLLDRPNLNIW